MIKIVVLALAFGIAYAVPVPAPLPVAPVIPGAAIHTSTHHTGIGYGGYGGLAGFGYPGAGSTFVKHSEVAATPVVSPYGYGAFPGLGGLGMGYGAYGGFPAAKAITQVTTTAVRPSWGYGYY